MSENDLTLAIRSKAAEYPNVEVGLSCNQHSFKVGKKSFLFTGPGAKGVGFKAMFTLSESISEAQELSFTHPKHFQVGEKWVTVRFSDDAPFEEKLWDKWLDESYKLATA